VAAVAAHTVYLSLGSNLGDRAAQINQALAQLVRHGVRTIRRSSLYETEPVEFYDQGWFLNCAVEAQTDLTPEELLAAIIQIEKTMGRKRIIHAGPRTIDIDILLYDAQIVRTADLEIPHPRMAARRFVLVPMAEIAPGLRHPMAKSTMEELLAATPDRSEVRIAVPREIRREDS
jgi:2-amino-4-hydroxy-6-hydroxymethyldihydropteridine diphosphokinase